MSIGEIIYSYLPAKRKQTPSGWVKFNAVCCHHNGTTADNRARGGMIQNGDGISYHCFNCGFKASYQPGRHVTRKMRQLLSWLGVPDDTVNKITLEALKIQSDETALAAVAIPKFEDKPLPDGSLRISEWIENIQKLPDDLRAQFDTVVEYIWSRKLDPMADFYWCPVAGFADRLIVPFRLEGRIVGHTARKVVEGKPKYISDQTPGYVFNLDSQTQDREFVIVVEGPMDALSIDAVAVLGAEIMDKQALLINRLNRAVIVVPDRDADGQRTVEQALLNGYAVSMPDWPEGIKDVNDAAQKLGQLTALYLVIQAQEHNELKVRLRAKTWF
jgi:hypothetical protein